MFMEHNSLLGNDIQFIAIDLTIIAIVYDYLVYDYMQVCIVMITVK